jgi:hypothetical protein
VIDPIFKKIPANCQRIELFLIEPASGSFIASISRVKYIKTCSIQSSLPGKFFTPGYWLDIYPLLRIIGA